MSARVELTDAHGWPVVAFIPCRNADHARQRVMAKYPGCVVHRLEITEAAHA
jgi:hypothetical protein